MLHKISATILGMSALVRVVDVSFPVSLRVAVECCFLCPEVPLVIAGLFWPLEEGAVKDRVSLEILYQVELVLDVSSEAALRDGWTSSTYTCLFAA